MGVLGLARHARSSDRCPASRCRRQRRGRARRLDGAEGVHRNGDPRTRPRDRSREQVGWIVQHRLAPAAARPEGDAPQRSAHRRTRRKRHRTISGLPIRRKKAGAARSTSSSPGMDRRGMARLGAGTAGEVLPPHRFGPAPAFDRSRRVGADVSGDRPRLEVRLSPLEASALIGRRSRASERGETSHANGARRRSGARESV